jgi:CRP/FNR family transcriptional regulator, anaerobic regulatory protein
LETNSHIKKEAINWIVDEGNVACSVVSLFKRVLSVEYLEAVEDTEFLSISYFDLSALSEINLSICKLVNKWTIEYLVMYDKRLDIFRNTKPEQRLQIFINSQPHLLKRLSKKEIASYLDIAPGTLSRAFHKLQF